MNSAYIKLKKRRPVMSEIVYMFWVVLIFWFVLEIISEKLNKGRGIEDIFHDEKK